MDVLSHRVGHIVDELRSLSLKTASILMAIYIASATIAYNAGVISGTVSSDPPRPLIASDQETPRQAP
jgi:hypothetical protein